MSRLIDTRKLALVARFELAEALRSRLIVLVLALYGAGAALGTYIFAGTLAGAERTVRDSLDGTLSVPDNLVRQQVLPGLIKFWVDDPALQNQLLDVEPLAIFYGFMAFNLVAGLVLVTSGNAHASEISTGGTRFVLTRVDRLSWALGKLAGHAVLLLVGLFVGAFATGVVAWSGSGIDATSALWLGRVSLRAWVYGVAYLGLFSLVGLVVRSPSRVRSFSVALLFLLWLGRALCSSPLVTAQVPLLAHLVWVFPAQYELALWSPRWLESLSATGALIAIAVCAFALGFASFRRGDV